MEDEELIKNCNLLLRFGAYKEVRDIIKTRQSVRSELSNEMERARAIADVLYAAENPLPDGSEDLYGMVRMTSPGPLFVKEFKNLMHLLSSTHNRFPFCYQARVKASSAWSELCSQTTRDGENLDQTQENFIGDVNVGENQIGNGDNLDQRQGYVLRDVDVGGIRNGGGQVNVLVDTVGSIQIGDEDNLDQPQGKVIEVMDVGGSQIGGEDNLNKSERNILGDMDVGGGQISDEDNIDQPHGYVLGNIDVGGRKIGDEDNLDQLQGNVIGDMDVGGSQTGDGQRNFFRDMDVGGNQIGDEDNLDQPQRNVLRDIDVYSSQFGDGQGNVLRDIDVDNSQISDRDNLDQPQGNLLGDMDVGGIQINEGHGNVFGYIDVGGSQRGDGSFGDITDVGCLSRERNKDGVNKRKLDTDSHICPHLCTQDNLEGFEAINVDPLLPPEKPHAPPNQTPPEGASSVAEKHDDGDINVSGNQNDDGSFNDITDASGLCEERNKNGVNKRKRETDSLIFPDLPVLVNLEWSEAKNVDLLPPLEKPQAPHDQAPSEDAFFVPKKPYVGPATINEIIIIYDDDKEDEHDHMDISLAVTGRVSIVNGIRVKNVPLN